MGRRPMCAGARLIIHLYRMTLPSPWGDVPSFSDMLRVWPPCLLEARILEGSAVDRRALAGMPSVFGQTIYRLSVTRAGTRDTGARLVFSRISFDFVRCLPRFMPPKMGCCQPPQGGDHRGEGAHSLGAWGVGGWGVA